MMISANANLEHDSLPTRRSLLSRLRDIGDDTSWRVFFETYWRLIYNVARKSGLSDEDAQDIVQDTVICVARKIPEFHYDAAKGSFKQWLLLITRRRIHDRLRRLYRSIRVTDSSGVEFAERSGEVVSSISSPDLAIDAAWEEEWRQNIYASALDRVRQRVSPKHFQVFDYCVLRDVPPARVAKMLGLSAPQVYLAKHRVSAAVKRAAAEVEEELGRASPKV